MITALVICLVVGLLFAVLIYPGELSHLSPRLNKWLYDRAASSYEQKWKSRNYADPHLTHLLGKFVHEACRKSSTNGVLDLGCGTGRGIRTVVDFLDSDSHFTGIDFSKPMLDIMRGWLINQDQSLSNRITLIQKDLSTWADDSTLAERYGVVMMLEVGEFLPHFQTVVTRAASCVANGGGMVLTRPAGLWCLFFPGRHQSRKELSKLLCSLRFSPPQFVAWRSRYELVFSQKLPD